MLRLWGLLFVFILFLPYSVACSQKQAQKTSHVSVKDTVVSQEIGQPVGNLERFAKFVQNYEKGTKDSIRILTVAPDGKPVPNDLTYDGKRLKLEIDSRTYTGTKLVKNEDDNYVKFEMQLLSDLETYFPILYLPKIE